jgi:hypothetical protein
MGKIQVFFLYRPTSVGHETAPSFTVTLAAITTARDITTNKKTAAKAENPCGGIPPHF